MNVNRVLLSFTFRALLILHEAAVNALCDTVRADLLTNSNVSRLIGSRGVRSDEAWPG